MTKSIPIISPVLVSTLNTARDGTGTVATVVTAAGAGYRIKRIKVKAIVTTTAGMIRIFLHTGAAFFLWTEIPVTAITVGADTAGFEYTLELFNDEALELPAGYSIRASTHNGESFHVSAEGDYL